MIAALCYLQFHSIVNRTVARLRRLRQPKYLLGGIAGAVYFYFYFLRYAFGPRRAGPSQLFGSADPLLIELIAASVLGLVIFLAWVIPHQRAALVFSEAEVAFLFPAPISRRGLIQFKLLRAQVAILFSTLIFTLLLNRFGGKAWIHAGGWWVILSTLNLHLLAASFGRSMLLDRGISNWKRRLIILGALGLVLVAALIWAGRSLPGFDVRQITDWQSVSDYLHRLFTAGPVAYVLYPFRLVVRPMLAPGAAAFLLALLPALVIIAAHYLWVIRCDVAFEEASMEASRQVAEKVAAMRAGNWQQARRAPKRRRAPFRLRPGGAAAVGVLWKNLISTGQVVSLRLAIVLAVVSVAFCSSLGSAFGQSNLAAGLAMLAAMFIIWSLLLGPQFLRQDFRQDLQLADVLKGLPMRGWQVALGEVLAPAVVLTAIHWLLLIAGLALFLGSPEKKIPPGLVFGGALGAAVLLPFLNLLMMQIPNAAVLLLPAWFQTGKEAPQGIEATGQRLILIFGQMLAFVVAILPAAFLFGLVLFIVKLAGSTALALPPAAFAAALVLALESAFGIYLLGKLFERFDVSSEFL